MRRKHRWGHREGQGAQSLVEFALLAPVLMFILLLTIDFGRLVYTYGAISWATREGARLASLEPQKTSDCMILQRVEAVGRGFPLVPDPNSIVGNSDPNNPSGSLVPSPPTAGSGFIYIYPAVALRAPQDTNCDGGPRKTSGGGVPVAVEIQYRYVPIVPLIADFVPAITITAISVVPTEY